LSVELLGSLRLPSNAPPVAAEPARLPSEYADATNRPTASKVVPGGLAGYSDVFHVIEPTGMGLVTDQELAQRCRDGDRQARRTLYDRTADRIYRLALRMTRNPDDAFDLAQETYLRAFTHMDQFDGRSSLATWLYRIALNEVLHFLRQRAGRSRQLHRIAAEQQAARRQQGSPQSRPVSDRAPEADPARRLDVQEALARLDETDRIVLLLRYQEGFNYRDLAEVMQCEPGTVASRLNRARHRLAELLAAWDERREEPAPVEHPTS